MEQNRHSIDLNKYLDQGEVETMYTFWVLGIEVEETIELLDDVKIIPIKDMPDSTYKEDFLQSEPKLTPYVLPCPKCAIVITAIGEKSDNLDKDITNIRDSFLKIDKISCLLNLIGNTSCLPCLQTREVSGSLFSEHGSSSPPYDVLGNNNMTTKLSKENIKEVEKLFKKLSDLNDKEQSRFVTIINRIRQAKRHSSIEDKILDLGIAVEMMLLEDNDKSQLKLQFRLRGSLLIAKDNNNKEEYFKDFGELYDYRSSVAHSGMLKDSERKNIKKNESLKKYFNLAEEVCKTLILEGKPNWNKLILGIEDTKKDRAAS
ncbi:MAG: hypothetical protein LGB78_03590 [Sulfurovum sp.]|nr:hypothetical protein [Sulfurovum sp.]